MMLSRAAEAVYWMNRYMERAENYARILDVNMHMSLDLPEGMEEQWRPLVLTTGDVAMFEERYGSYDQASVMRFLVSDGQNPNSVLSCLRAARENARTVRDAISSEMWHQLNAMHLAGQDLSAVANLSAEACRSYLQSVKVGSQLFAGIMDAGFSHGEGWNFGMLGRLLERADKTTRIVDMKYFYLLPAATDVGTTFDLLQWTALLKSVSAFEMYRKTHGQADASRIVSFLLLDREFPRSVYYCVRAAREALGRLPEDSGRTESAARLIGKLDAELEFLLLDEVFAGGLHEFLDSFQTRLNEVGAAIAGAFFTAYEA